MRDSALGKGFAVLGRLFQFLAEFFSLRFPLVQDALPFLGLGDEVDRHRSVDLVQLRRVAGKVDGGPVGRRSLGYVAVESVEGTDGGAVGGFG